MVDHKAARESHCPVVDVHIHPKVEETEFLADLDHAGITHAVVLATDTDPADMDIPGIREWLLDAYLHSEYRYQISFEMLWNEVRSSLRSKSHVDNAAAAQWSRKYPHRLIAFGSVSLCRPPDTVQRTLEEISRLGCKGIKLLPYSQFFNPSSCDNVELLLDYCGKNDLPILCHTGCAAGIFESPEFSRNSRPMLWDEALKRHPDQKLILAHFGAYSAYYPGIWFDEALELMRRHENVYADLAAVTALLGNGQLMEHVRNTCGLDRVLFGSDYPMPRFVPGGSLAEVIDMIWELPHLSIDEKQGILGMNAAKLLKLENVRNCQ